MNLWLTDDLLSLVRRPYLRADGMKPFRYPKAPLKQRISLDLLMERAENLTKKLIEITFQRSGLVVGPSRTAWFYRDESNTSEIHSKTI